MKKTIKGWAVIDRTSGLVKAYDRRLPIIVHDATDKCVPCTITFTLPTKKK